MKTSVVWLFSNGAREFNIHEVNQELFDKLRPVFDTPEQEEVGKITVDKDTTIVFTRSKTERMKLSMKTDCEFFDECRRPVQVCNAKCPDYKPRKRDKKADCANVGERKTDSSRLRKETKNGYSKRG